jgi:hypothetical protein
MCNACEKETGPTPSHYAVKRCGYIGEGANFLSLPEIPKANDKSDTEKSGLRGLPACRVPASDHVPFAHVGSKKL